MKMRYYITNFLSYLKIEKNASPLTIYDYRLELEKFVHHLLKNNVTDINSVSISTIRSYIYHIKDVRNLSNTSIHKKIAILKSFFNFLAEEEIVLKNPAIRIKTPKKEVSAPRLISKFEINKIIGSVKFAPPRCRKNYIRDKLLLSTLYYTGIRRSELLNLNWSDLNLEKSTLTVRNGKGKKDRVIPLHPMVQKLLDEYLDQMLPLRTNALFVGESGRRLCKNSFYCLIRMYFKLSGLGSKGYTAHSFRHSFATHLIESGADIFKVQKLLGHSSLDSTKIYVTFYSRSLADTISNL